MSSEPGVGDHWGHTGELRAYGTLAAVPLPPSIVLFVTGLIGLCFTHKKVRG